MANVQNNKEMVPFEHYVGLFRALDPVEAAQRCGVRYDGGTFRIRLLSVDYDVAWPEFAIASETADGLALTNVPAQILIMRYLLEGRASCGTGAFLPYREMPWGEDCLKSFTGRCLTRAAYAFGTRLEAFDAAMARSTARRIKGGDSAWQVEILPGYEVQLIVWEGEDEFPPSAQILFSDNFPQAFSAEDRTVVGDLLITDIKRRM